MYYGKERYTYRKQNNTWKMTSEETSRNCRLLHSSQVRALSMKKKKKIWTDINLRTRFHLIEELSASFYIFT